MCAYTYYIPTELLTHYSGTEKGTYSLTVFFCLEKVVDAEKQALPQNIAISETSCKVPLADLLDHTVKQLLQKLSLEFGTNETQELILDIKYGFDGTNVTAFKQISQDKTNKFTDMFCASLVPLRLINKRTKELLWVNPRPSSTALCRPIELNFEKETAELSLQKEAALNAEIRLMEPIKEGNIIVQINMLLTMIDGKVIE